jgi:hypothetical protein
LRSIIIPNSVTNIGNYAFSGCLSLSNVIIGNSVVAIGNSFQGCSSLTSMIIPNSVVTIGYAFQTCYGLTNITIGSGALSILVGAFDHCPRLTAINVDANNPAYSSGSGILFSKGLTVVVKCPEAKPGDVIIPDSVVNIEFEAFYLCTNITTIYFGSGITNVGTYAFDGCNNVTNVTLGSGLTNAILRYSDFWGLQTINVNGNNPAYSSLDGMLYNHDRTRLILCPKSRPGNYQIPAGVHTIGESAFYGCYLITNITIPSSTASIESGAFSGCARLVGVYFQGDAPVLGVSVFGTFLPVVTYPTCYYLPGTIGWSGTFGGCTTVPWRLPYPLILTTPSTFGVQSGGFGFTVSWATNLSVVVEASTNLSSPLWQRVQTNTLTNGAWHFTDLQSSNFSDRFYRVRLP